MSSRQLNAQQPVSSPRRRSNFQCCDRVEWWLMPLLRPMMLARQQFLTAPWARLVTMGTAAIVLVILGMLIGWGLHREVASRAAPPVSAMKPVASPVPEAVAQKTVNTSAEQATARTIIPTDGAIFPSYLDMQPPPAAQVLPSQTIIEARDTREEQYRAAILAVLQQEKQLHERMNAARQPIARGGKRGGGPAKSNPASPVSQYIAGLKAIDLSHCPADFRDAYLDHLRAWAEYELARTADSGNSGLGSLIGIGIALYTGNVSWALGGLAKDVASNDQANKSYGARIREADARIGTAWHVVKTVSASHGAKKDD